MSFPVLTVNELAMKFGTSEVFKNISFSVARGETLGLFGKSGSGKTTIGRCIVGLEKPTGGKILVHGEDILSMGKKEFRKLRPKIQMIFQHPETSLDPRMKAFENLIEPLKIHSGLKQDSLLKRGEELAELTGLRPEHLVRYPGHLSGGEIQRIVLARIMALSPDFIVADEPTSMLDVSVQAQILRLMQKLQRETGVSYLLISHNLEVLRKVCHRIAYLENGTITSIENINRGIKT
ncbi:peptide ABC transporter ATP-binding protein [Methanosarcina sp. 2.H.T.1A.6]|uniref:ABC transporter ATP-binding protein n=1 Tax=unclassified Methanosarcina TaxID=2644672 RepID=UPI0006222689|nr:MULTISPECIES: dipeptide/oligopeptide/nickel ABC transporter ATP-binding protein [unclassified Methanosarcina]KKG16221.1 peptide ABC transporter ATP-binding protein [Methanosarcina sp. 2.H.T.1A.3]KKG20686.1 peptide ABC transporter ATP-binding protein [Methanosarcina sp. 2.H.T.1A.15]KKG23059.1 peptide ABC transporter ATP-binding protein [Methanosarcina sp. 2.H.T.1A.6]KKG26282.1 peptide ABC transporter ATP-binding protein [Methanosarcina sp. 2.H.T.1A.8]